MDAQRKDRRDDPMPAVVTAIIAVVCTAAIVLIDFGPGSGSVSSADARTITAAAVARAGAIEIPPERPATQAPQPGHSIRNREFSS
jgi:hypothetical protein